MIRVAIVDDHDLLRAGIRAILEQDPLFEVVGESGDGQDAIRMVTKLLPDVVLMDVHLPGRIGAKGYLPKRSVTAQLKEAIKAVHAGQRYLHPVAAEELVEMVTTGQSL